MKNKKLYKYFFYSLIDIALSIILTLITLFILRETILILYHYTKIQLINYVWDLWNIISFSDLDRLVYLLLTLLTFLLYYFLLTYRKNKSLVDIIEETEIMAKGDLDKSININSKGDIKKLADNINSISKQLKDRTIEERRAQQTKNDLITNVSHDLRTPLTSIIGYLEVIQFDKYKDEIQLRYYIDITYEKAQSLNLLINDLFELTKMQNNTINIKKSEINLVELLGQIVAYFECHFKKANMESRINFSEDKLIINADSQKLVRAFENLLSNSIKYGKDGHYVDITTTYKQNNAIIHITNYGQPIPEMSLPYIFDRFYRVEKSRNSNISGSGLGLAITKNIIELHDGTIKAYSNQHRTIFEIKLPVKHN